MKNFGKKIHEENAFILADEMLLWSFIDGTVTETEKKEIEQLIVSNAQWKEKYAELLQLNELLQSTEVNQPSPGLTKNIMKQVAHYRPAPPIASYISKKVLYAIGGVLLTLILIFYIFVLKNADLQSTKDGSVIMPHSSTGYKFSHSNWGRISIYLLIAGNVMLGFYLLGRYLKSKRKHYL
jgi:hypothetical protein